MIALRVAPTRFAPIAVAAMLRGIVALSFEVRAVEAKFKASQNKSVIDQRGVMRGLRQDAAMSEPAKAAALIEERLAVKP